MQPDDISPKVDLGPTYAAGGGGRVSFASPGGSERWPDLLRLVASRAVEQGLPRVVHALAKRLHKDKQRESSTDAGTLISGGALNGCFVPLSRSLFVALRMQTELAVKDGMVSAVTGGRRGG